MDAVELWRESIPEESRIDVAAGAALVGAGFVSALVSITRRRGGFFAWAVPGMLLSAGVVVLAHALLDVRGDRIAETQSAIEAQLATLDPLARAHVLKNVSQNQLRAVLPHRS